MPKSTPHYNLQVINPLLAKQWHPTKNGAITPRNVTPFSNRRVWWMCDEGHEWEAIVYLRTRGNSCPHCLKNTFEKYKSLERLYPGVARQWHPTKNGSLKPNHVSYGSGKKVWWICSKGHEWLSTVKNRSQGKGCPYCLGRFPTASTCLEAMNPSLAKQWHPTKNGTLTPKDVVPGSGKKAWWLCDKGHEWEAAIRSRNSGNRCPYCSRFNRPRPVGKKADEIKKLYDQGLNKAEIARRLNIGRTSVRGILRDYFSIFQFPAKKRHATKNGVISSELCWSSQTRSKQAPTSNHPFFSHWQKLEQ